jgi:hypothetical protein
VTCSTSRARRVALTSLSAATGKHFEKRTSVVIYTGRRPDPTITRFPSLGSRSGPILFARLMWVDGKRVPCGPGLRPEPLWTHFSSVHTRLAAQISPNRDPKLVNLVFRNLVGGPYDSRISDLQGLGAGESRTGLAGSHRHPNLEDRMPVSLGIPDIPPAETPNIRPSHSFSSC